MPINRIKTREKQIITIFDDQALIRGIGNRRTISISKIKNRTANKKNRVENGIRAEDLGSNPHSNGEDFSRSLFDFIARFHARKMTKIATRVAVKIEKDGKIIGIGEISHN